MIENSVEALILSASSSPNEINLLNIITIISKQLLTGKADRHEGYKGVAPLCHAKREGPAGDKLWPTGHDAGYGGRVGMSEANEAPCNPHTYLRLFRS